MIPESESKVDTQPAAGPVPPQPTSHVVTVDGCGLQMSRLRLKFLFCSPGQGRLSDVELATVKASGRLVPNSHNEVGFLAAVTWSLVFEPEGIQPPIAISGEHEVQFGTTIPIDYNSAQYYADINSVILIYPYLRQLISDLAIRSLGQCLIVRPLDVPRFVRERTQARAHASGARNTGTIADGEEAPR